VNQLRKELRLDERHDAGDYTSLTDFVKNVGARASH
jgi:hypothetical protein